MKKLSIILVAICLTLTLHAAVPKTVNCTIAGTLTSYFNVGERTTVTDLTLSGTIDARDFKFIRDTLTALEKIDMSTVTIVEYYGTGGTFPSNSIYNDNSIPPRAFIGKIISSFILPNTLTQIENAAFEFCLNLTSIIIPSNVTSIGAGIFTNCTSLSQIQFNCPSAPPLNGFPDGQLILGSNLPNPCNIYVPQNTSAGYFLSIDGGWGLMNYPNFSVWDGQTIPNSTSENLSLPQNLSILKQGTTAIVSNLTIGNSLDVYSLLGYNVYSTTINNSTMTIHFPAQGIYIVKVGAYTQKIII